MGRAVQIPMYGETKLHHVPEHSPGESADSEREIGLLVKVVKLVKLLGDPPPYTVKK